MDGFELIRIVPEAERPTEKPISPRPVCHGTGTDEEWEIYWRERDAYYHGIELRKI